MQSRARTLADSHSLETTVIMCLTCLAILLIGRAFSHRIYGSEHHELNESLGFELTQSGSSDGCDWSCCRPLTLHLHASAAAIPDPDPQNDPNQIDIVLQQEMVNAQVPIRFKIYYKQAHGQGPNEEYEGVVPNFGQDNSQIQKIGTWPSASRFGTCGQDGFSPTEIIMFAPWHIPPRNFNYSLLSGSTLCGTDALIDPNHQPECFTDTDYFLTIVRTLKSASGSPNDPALCFTAIRVWVDSSVDDLSVLSQHDYDNNLPGPCPAPDDEYQLARNRPLTIGRHSFTSLGGMIGLPPNECREPGESLGGSMLSPGGQWYEACIFADFQKGTPTPRPPTDTPAAPTVTPTPCPPSLCF